VYKISTRTLRKTDVIRVGEVPKYLATSPDGRYLLVGNWCSWDLSVVDLEKGREIRRIPAGISPRGIAFSPNGRRAYVGLVGENAVLVIDMDRLEVVRRIEPVGDRPRHLVMSPDGAHLYIASQGQDSAVRRDGTVLKMDLRTRRIVGRVKGLLEPRTMVLAPDGRSLYAVDYHAGRVLKIRTSDMRVLQSRYLGVHPVGIAYDEQSRQVWVAGYTGSLWVLKDR
jgi:YVTN family beta-propeller protein